MPNAQLPPPNASNTTLVWLFFGFDGRISREVYWLSIGLLWCILFVTIQILTGTRSEEEAAGTVIMLAIASLWIEMALLVKRQHDRGLPWYWCLLAFVPIAGAVWMVMAGVLAGDAGANAYGSRPNSRPG
mgnify:CR=1 FL=1